MRFDVERTLALAQTWPSPRLAGSEAEHRAADQLANHLERAGLAVERIESDLSDSRVAALMICCFNMATVTAIAQPGVSRWLRAGSLVAAWASLIAAFWLTARRASAAGDDRRRSRCIIGRPASKSGATPKVVFVTRLDSAGEITGMGVLPLGLFYMFALLPIPCLSQWYAREASLIPTLGRTVFLTEWFLALMVVLFWPGPASVRPIRDDNRTGLALLVELALNRIGSAGGTMETWFVATSNAIQLPEELKRRVGGDAPVLAIWLYASGVGDDVILGGRGRALGCARQAARDLWIPHRAKADVSVFNALMVWIHRKYIVPYIRLRGARDDLPVTPALLSATAQLAAETALRWAKQVGPATPLTTPDSEW